MYQEMKEEENPPALKILSIHQYNDLKITLENIEEDWL